MKTLAIITTLIATYGLSPLVQAEDKNTDPTQKEAPHDHNHDHAEKAGPNGGRLLTQVEPHIEFFVTKEKKVELRFFDHDHKILAPQDQIITVTLGDRKSPTNLTFTKDGDKLISDKTVPAGNDYPTIVTIKPDAKAKAVNAKFNLNLTQCSSCSNLEYACICEHH
jgi:hypothetical protein